MAVILFQPQCVKLSQPPSKLEHGWTTTHNRNLRCTGNYLSVPWLESCHYNDIIISMMASEITSVPIVYWTICSGADQRKYQSSASLAFVRGIYQWPVNSPHKIPVMQKMFPFDDVIMDSLPECCNNVVTIFFQFVAWFSIPMALSCKSGTCAGKSIPQWATLTHLPLDKMADILADDIFKSIFLNEKDKIPVQISLKLVPGGPTDNKPALVQVMVWRRTGDKPLPEPMLAQFTVTYMRH